jgi:hypothetical protein
MQWPIRAEMRAPLKHDGVSELGIHASADQLASVSALHQTCLRPSIELKELHDFLANQENMIPTRTATGRRLRCPHGCPDRFVVSL